MFILLFFKEELKNIFDIDLVLELTLVKIFSQYEKYLKDLFHGIKRIDEKYFNGFHKNIDFLLNT